MTTIKTAMFQLKELSSIMGTISKMTGYKDYGDMSNLEWDGQNPDERFLSTEIHTIVEMLDDARRRIEYLNRPIVETTEVFRNSDGRFETPSGHVYTSGCGIECLLVDDDEQEWVWASVEHDGSDYYVTTYNKPRLHNLTVRIRG